MIEYQLIDRQEAINYEKKIKYLLKQLFENDKKNSDFDTINKIYNNILQYLEDKSAIIYGAFDNKNLVAFIWAYKRIVDNKTRYHINYFIVEDEWRKRGIGSNLIKKINELAKKNGVEIIELMVCNENKSAINFYSAFEFEVEKQVMIKKTMVNEKD